MLRRQHTKSRNGCSECKRRHVRCDEQRPSCTNCIKAKRKCEYIFKQRKHQRKQLPIIDTTRRPPIWFCNRLSAPMYEVLAISARHLSTIDSDDFKDYYRLSIELQTKALALYNVDASCVDEQSCVASLLFSPILARHILLDVLAIRHLNFAAFLSRFVQCIRIHHGKKAITYSKWSILKKSELGPLIAQGFDSSEGQYAVHLNEEFDNLLSHAARNNPESEFVYRTALGLLEAGFEDLRKPERNRYGLRLMFSWITLVPHGYIDLLEQHRQEAIAILGRYAILLHFGQFLWQIRDAGPRLLDMVLTFLGKGWEAWLKFPSDLPVQNGAAPGL
ncbi:putative Zn(II)2Cys6 transcription factor [Xylaria sp. FL1042]|nr:putative Zn(II)2Cys6 transcription factor [Xylaria sp. FL1042]